jgi:hypothetical protein
MLVKKYEKNDVVSVKLMSGEELVARFASIEDNVLTVSKPVIVVPHGEGMAFAPFMMTTQETNFSIDMKSVVVIVATADELAKNYIKTTTGILT